METAKRSASKLRIAVFSLALVAALFAFVGCQPAASNSPKDEASSSASAGMVVGDFQSPNAGDLTGTDFNTNFVNDGNRGCNSCHEDLWDVMNDLSPIQHVLSSAPGYGQAYGIIDCMPCHSGSTFGGPNFAGIIHVAHYRNPQFTDEQNGNCWSCHEIDSTGATVLWDLYKYSEELGGFVDSAGAGMQSWMNLRTQSNSSIVDVVSTPEMKLDVKLTQPVSDEADMFAADNYVIPDIDPDKYEVSFTGVVNERSFTLAELKAMPQVERTIDQICLTNAIGGSMIGNFPVKGVLFKDVLDACGGPVEGNDTVLVTGEDGWYRNLSVQFLIDQEAMLVFEYWGHELTADQGYPCVLAIPGIGGSFWVKYLDTFALDNTGTGIYGAWMGKQLSPDAIQGVQCSTWFTPETDGQEFKVGEPVKISGFAHVDANDGHAISGVAFSADYGHTWTEIAAPADVDPYQWIFWEGTWTPEQAGTYVLHVKALDAGGDEQTRPASVIVKVIE